ncbi:MAG: pyridoxamine 5'-phosphate oxidase family protein [Chloroflexota bacterium]
MQNYSGAVPAVQKTIAVLEHLRAAAAAPTLTELSQALCLNRSSLLAILNTLRGASFVTRDDADRYHLGPGLLPYGSAVTTGLREAFDRPAEWLVEATGESVALTHLAAEGAVCVAFKMGRHSVRAMAELGQVTPVARSAGGLAILAGPTRTASTEGQGEDGHTFPGNHPHPRSAAGTSFVISRDPRPPSMPIGTDSSLDARNDKGLAISEGITAVLEAVRTCGCAYVENGPDAGQAALAAPVCDATGQVVAAMELLAPWYRLNASGNGLRTAGRLVIGAARQASLALGCSDYEPYQQPRSCLEPWRGSGAAGLHGADLDVFLAQPWLASLACLRENGYPYTVPVWYEWRGGVFWLAPRLGARWAGYLCNHPRVSMTISEPAPPFRRVLVEGRATQAKGSAAAMVKRMAERYLGSYAGSYLATTAGRHGPAIRVAPDKVTSWEGLVARVPASPPGEARRAN